MTANVLNRRRWLQAAGLLGAGSIANLTLGTREANAADYKALVCVFLYGGNDGLNTVVPLDNNLHAQYSAVRQGLALPRSSLVTLGRSGYGLHPALSALAGAASDGVLAPVLNVGPLHAPLTKAQYAAAPKGSPLVPSSLFSHSDQQTLWETSASTPFVRAGWGGRTSELGSLNPVISFGGNARFGMSSQQGPLVLPAAGAPFGPQGLDGQALAYAPGAARLQALQAMYSQSQTGALRNAYSAQQRYAFAVADVLGPLVNALPADGRSPAPVNSAFAPLTAGNQLTTSLSRQLYQVAKLIAARTSLPGNRQIFFVQLDGFDTHAEQATAGNPTQGIHANLLKELGDALAAFHGAMKNIGMAEAVTTFTKSDFGRTFKPNNSGGTDHAWGNHQLVLGGAVRGHTAYGTMPELVLGGRDDLGSQSWEQHGRWIPGTSVDQYAATLLSWFGAQDGQLDALLPNLGNFGTRRNLGFV